MSSRGVTIPPPPVGFTAPYNPGWGWGVFILPYIEQQNLWNLVNPPLNPLATVMASNLPALQMPIKIYQCPSDTPGAQGPYLNDRRPFQSVAGTNPPVYVTISNYGCCSGNNNSGLDPNGNGMCNANSSTRITDITDGSSNTIMIAERARFNAGIYDSKAFNVWGQDDGDADNYSSDQGLMGWTDYQMQSGHTGTGLDLPRNAYGSMHPGGAMFLMCDGSVHFLASSIAFGATMAGQAPQTYNALGGMQDGLVPGPW